MGRLIDNSCEPKSMSKEEIVDTLKTMVFGVQAFDRFDAKEREALDKAWNLIDQYENRLKADMVAMLTDIQLEIEELDLKDSIPDYQKGAEETREYISDLLQQKIDALKGEQEAADGKD